MKQKRLTKTLLSLLLIFSILIASFGVFVVPSLAELGTFDVGDIDTDGDIDAADYILIKRSVLKNYTLTGHQELLADVDDDGDVDATDYVLVKRIVLGTYALDTEEEEPKDTSKDTSEDTSSDVADDESTDAIPPHNSSFEVHFIDVGQADAALVMCDGKAMLIDGGNVGDSSTLYSYLQKYDITHLDYVIGTHAHEDHIGGIAGALNYASVGIAYCPVKTYSSKAFENFVKAVENHGVSITVPSVGTTFSLGSASCQVLAVNVGSDTNNTSIVLRITYGDTSFMFTGDAELEVEQEILNQGFTLQSTVLKVGHHGSETSTGYVWLREVMPEYAVISVGTGNSYGHPTEEVLSRLRDAEVNTFRTDMQGDIICVSDGNTVTFTVSKNPDADVFGGIGENSTQKPNESESPAESEEDETKTPDYVLNTSSKKFHHPNCSNANRISESNRQEFYGTREELIAMGYSSCGVCDS